MKQTRRQKIKRNLGGGNRRRGKHPGNTPLTAPLTTPQARHMAGAEARSEYGPTIRAAKGELRGSKMRQGEIGDWYSQLSNQINQAAQATDASYAQANNALLAHAQAAADAAAKTQGSIAQNNAATANLVGADPSLFAAAQNEGAAAANQRQLTYGALAAPIAQSGASQAAYLRNTGINATRQGIADRQKESKRRKEIKEDLTALRKERAQKTVGNFRDIRGEERDYGIQRSAFNLDKQEAAQNARDDAVKNRLARRSARTSERNAEIAERNAGTSARNARTSEESAAETRRHDRATEKGGGGDRQNAWSAAKSLFEKRTWPSWAALETKLRKESEVTPAAARWAIQKLRKQIEREGREEKRRTQDPNRASLGR
jgi:hypothetical protein